MACGTEKANDNDREDPGFPEDATNGIRMGVRDGLGQRVRLWRRIERADERDGL